MPLLVVVVAFRPLQQGDVLGAVDLGGVGDGGQGVLHGLLQPCAAEEDAVGPFQGLHVLYGKGVVVEAADGLVDHQGEGDVLCPPGDLGGKEVDGVGGGHQVQGAVVLGGRLPGPAGGQEQAEGQQQGQAFARHRRASFHGKVSETIYYTAEGEVCKTKQRPEDKILPKGSKTVQRTDSIWRPLCGWGEGEAAYPGSQSNP